MRERLNKPPIVAAWVGLRFAPGDETRPWGEKSATEFSIRHREPFPTARGKSRDQLIFENVAEGAPRIRGAERYLEEVQLLNEDEDRCFEIAENRAVYQLIAPGVRYPGFTQMLEEAEARFVDFQEFFVLGEIIDAAIYYEDLIRIPRDDEGSVQLKDYFRLSIDPPANPFGRFDDITVKARFQAPNDEGILEHELQVDPSLSDHQVVTFRQTWLKILENVGENEVSEVRKRFGTAQDYMWECFRASVTETTWALFEPEATMES